MFCRSCGSPLEGRGKFCTNCGVQVGIGSLTVPTPPPPPPQRRTQAWVYVLVAVGVLFFVGLLAAVFSDNSTNSSSPNQASSQTTKDKHRIGETVLVGYWAYRCDGVEWTNSIGSEYTREHPDAKFLVVDLSIRNNDKTASTLAPLKLVDSEGREYDESSKGVFLDNSFGIMKSVNPGVSSHGKVVFDVPSGRYALKVSGGFTSGESELIDLE